MADFNKAKRNKKDEFYTQIEDIEKELKHYKKHFKERIVYCNCDDPEWSNFWKYFKLNFKRLGLKLLISTHYEESGKPSYGLIYNGKAGRPRKIKLKGNGDFRDEECKKILIKYNPIVVTNPPFSLFREYISTLIDNNIDFLVIGNNGAVTYKEIFKLILANKIWLGYTSNATMEFELHSSYTQWTRKDSNGNKYGKVPAISWFTNLTHKKRNEKIIFPENQTYKGNENKYPQYDNCNAIEVSKVKYIPIDYKGIMGVPITFLCVYNPDQFEIVDSDEYKKFMIRGPVLNGKVKYSRLMIKHRNT